MLSRAQRTGNLEDAADLIHNALHQRFVESKKRKALPAAETKAVTVEPVVEPLVKQIEATTVPKKRGRPSLTPEEKAAREESARVAKLAKEQAKAETKAQKTKSSRQQDRKSTRLNSSHT